MTSKERVKAAFAFTQPDHTPLDYFAEPGIHAALESHFRVSGDHAVRACLGVDIRYVNPPYIGPKLPVFGDGSQMNMWGVIRKPMANEFGDYMEPSNAPYASWTTVEEAERFPWPDPDWYDYDAMPALCRQQEDLAIFAGSFGVQDFINGISFGRGVEQVLVDIAARDPVYLYLLERRHRFYMEHIERILRAAGGMVDAVLCGDDFGTQRGPLISPQTFREIFAPKKKELFDLVHSYGARVTHHCCGSSRDLIPSFLECGMDALQTIQPQARGMDPYDLKKAYHGKLVLHGAVDVQGWLQAASVGEIRSGIDRLLAEVGRGGGYIMSPSHQIQPDTPLEHVLAFYEAATRGR